MSIENHSNFHACKFITDIVASYYESLRGKASPKHCPKIDRIVREFVANVEERVDAFVMLEGREDPETGKIKDENISKLKLIKGGKNSKDIINEPRRKTSPKR